MSEFTYRAADKSGRISRGMIQALNTKDLELKLTRMGLWLIDVRTSGPSGFMVRHRTVPRKL
ncbi:MAG TPA: type II secretion system F family protein, partial [Magnetococcales bacterium]|nr:type II secretion system F family protein [Magnetococcales bacterium]